MLIQTAIISCISHQLQNLICHISDNFFSIYHLLKKKKIGKIQFRQTRFMFENHSTQNLNVRLILLTQTQEGKQI